MTQKHFPAIREIGNVHLWAITANMLVFSAHITLYNNNKYPIDQNTLVDKINEYLVNKYKIIESTIQITFQDEPETPGICPVLVENKW